MMSDVKSIYQTGAQSGVNNDRKTQSGVSFPPPDEKEEDGLIPPDITIKVGT